MLPLSYLREHTEKIKEGLAKRNFPHPELVDKLLETDQKRRSLQSQLDETLSKSNQLPKEVKLRRKLEQKLIYLWLPPFNKETRNRWSTTFTNN